MTRRSLAVLGLAVLFLLWPGRPLRASLPVARLTAPADGSVLTSGSLVEVAWEEVALPAHAEEWEAFLSFDGGTSYPLRVTPHLGLRLRRFSFRVPPFPTGNARILLRFGDEKREEVEVDTPFRYTIVLGNLPLLEPRLPALGRGESARPGEPGVVAWVEGDRSGRGLRYVVGRVEASSLAAVEPGSFFALGLAGPLPPTPVLSLPAAMRASTRSTTKRVSAVLEESGHSGTPVRLLIHRFNE